MLAAALACLSYIPFEYVAKGSLLMAVLLFILDPLPPLSRLLSLLLVIVVGVISKWYRQYIKNEFNDDDDDDKNNGVTIVSVVDNDTRLPPQNDAMVDTSATSESCMKKDI